MQKIVMSQNMANLLTFALTNTVQYLPVLLTLACYYYYYYLLRASSLL